MPTQVTRRNFRQYDHDDGLPGLIVPGYGTFLASSGTVAVTANQAYFGRFRPSRPMTIVNIKFALGAVAASSNDACDVGIYDATGTKIVTAGATLAKLNQTFNTLQTIAITSTTLAAGTTYYGALSVGAVGGTPAQLIMTNPGAGTTGPMGTWAGTTIGLRLAGVVAASHPLPTGPVTLTSSPVVPVMFLSEV